VARLSLLIGVTERALGQQPDGHGNPFRRISVPRHGASVFVESWRFGMTEESVGEGYSIKVEEVPPKVTRSCDTDGGWGVEKVEETSRSC